MKVHIHNIHQSLSQLQGLCDVVSKTICSDARRRPRDLDFLFLATFDSADMAARPSGKQCKDKADATYDIKMGLYAAALMKSLQTSMNY